MCACHPGCHCLCSCHRRETAPVETAPVERVLRDVLTERKLRLKAARERVERLEHEVAVFERAIAEVTR